MSAPVGLPFCSEKREEPAHKRARDLKRRGSENKQSTGKLREKLKRVKGASEQSDSETNTTESTRTQDQQSVRQNERARQNKFTLQQHEQALRTE